MNEPKRIDLYLTIVALLTLFGTALQTVLLIAGYDPQLTLYDRGMPSYLIPLVVLAIVFLSAVFSRTLSGGKLRFIGKPTFENHDADGFDDGDDSDTLARSLDLGPILLKIGALLLLIGAVLSGILLFYGDFPGDHAKDLWLSISNGSTESSVKLAGKLLQFSAYAGILAAVFPAVLLITGRGVPLSALAAVIWLLLLNLSVYFDNGAVLNDPCRSLEILGLSAAALWLICEIKRMLGGAGRRGYTFLSLSAFGILCISAVSRLIATAAGRLSFTSRTLVPVALLGIAIMIAGRLDQLRRTPPAPEEEAETEEDPGEKEKFNLKKEIRRTIYAPDTDLIGLPDGDESEEDSDEEDPFDPEDIGSVDYLPSAPAEIADPSDNLPKEAPAEDEIQAEHEDGAQ